MKVFTDQKEETLYTVPLNLHFIAVWTMFDIHVFFSKYFTQKRGNLLIRGKLPSLLNNCNVSKGT